MRIGELSRRTGVSVRMLRYYEQEGLLTPQRSASGYRDYGDAEEHLIGRIRLLKESGLKLSSIRKLMPCFRGDRSGFRPCAEVHATLQREIGELDDRIKRLRSIRRILAGYLDQIA